MAGIKTTFLLFLLGVIAMPSFAAEPLRVTADTTLEWHRDEQKIIARGNVKASQGGASINSATMTATYKEGEKENKFIPETLRAEGDVRIQTADGTAYGDTALYNINSEIATLTGRNLRLEAENLTLSANKEFKYFLREGMLLADGRAKLVQSNEDGDNIIEADQLTANFIEQSGQDERQLERMEAIGSVVITTPTETITGDKGFYNKITNQAELSGNVKVIRGQNTLEGALANVDLNTNISTLSGGTENKGRVSGVFYPE